MSNTLTSTHDLDVAHIIKVLLVDRGLRHSDLAVELGFDNGTMSRALNGKRKWTVEEIKHVANYFDVSVDLLLSDPVDIVRSRCFSRGQMVLPLDRQFAAAA